MEYHSDGKCFLFWLMTSELILAALRTSTSLSLQTTSSPPPFCCIRFDFTCFFLERTLTHNKNNSIMKYFQLLIGCSVWLSAQAFVVVAVVSRNTVLSSASSLQATKKRRRKRADEPNSSSEAPSYFADNDENELPDFDLGDNGDDSERTTPSSNKPRKASNLDEISVNMMGSSNQLPTRSINDLLKDRSLEQKFEFDDTGDDSLPDLAEFAGQKQVSRKVQRRQAAQARDASLPKTQEPLQLPFEMTNAKGEIQFNKVLEAGAWLGIFLLIGWEVYINSPFFERAAPMAPIVYDTPP